MGTGWCVLNHCQIYTVFLWKFNVFFPAFSSTVHGFGVLQLWSRLWWGKDWDYTFCCLNKKLFDFRIYFYKIVYQINVCYKMISSNYFFQKNNVSGEIITNILTGVVIQHYVDLILFISTLYIHKDFNWTLVLAEQAFEKTVGSW